jgi:hypothetical protein
MNFINNFRLKGCAKFLLFFLNFFISICLFFDQSAVASEPIEFKLAWDANLEDDLDGYEIYYRNGNDSEYDWIGEIYVDELINPDEPMVTITDLFNGVLADRTTPAFNVAQIDDYSIHYFALKAFDKNGNISAFSKELCLEVVGASVVECRQLDSSSSNSADNSGGGSGGGSGGCFISTSSNNPNEIMLPRTYLVMYSFGIMIVIALGLINRIKKYNL